MERIVVIFDLDGVLVDSMRAHYNSYKKLFRTYRVKYSLEEFIRSDITKGAMNVIPRVLRENKKNGDTEKMIEELHDIATREKAPLNSGVRQLLERLKRNKIRMVIATAGTRKFALHMLKEHRIREYFDFIMTGDDVSKPKPNPEIYFKTLKKLEKGADRFVAVEDSHDGVAAAKAAGIRVIGHKLKAEKQDLSEADAVVNNMKDITVKMIRELASEKKK